MSDFFSAGWSVYIALAVILSLAGCLALLIITARGKSGAADGTTGHVWDDDLREMNNPMPRWWMWLFVITIDFGLLYLVAYPGLGSYEGQLKWSTVGEHAAEVAAAQKALEPLYAQFTAKKTEELAGDAAAMAVGERLFMNNCAQCHGSDARGSKGFPNLTDHDWLHGGEPDVIKTTILNGRNGVMPPMGAALGSEKEVDNVAQYVLSLSGSTADPIKSVLGRNKFMANCAACHGAEGKGNQVMGAPNLSDRIWLYGGSADTIMETIRRGRNNTMPAFKDFLGDGKVHVLAAYVWSLSNIPEAAPH
jgi:cytochrome c oxidase cbb3-type subunit 3